MNFDTVDVVKTVAIGTSSGTGDGTLHGETLSGQPNTATRLLSPVRAIAIRFIKTFLVLISTFSGLGGLSDLLPTSTAEGALALVQQLDIHAAITLALVGAVGGLVKDLIFIFTGLEQAYPLTQV